MDEDFSRAYRQNVQRVYAFFAYRTLSAADSEDLTQLTFERALRAWSRFDPGRASAGTWTLAIAKNVLSDHYRRGPRSVEEPVAEPRPAGFADGGFDSSLGLEPELEAALARLGQRDREVVALRFGAGLPGPEIAELLGLSLANVQQILSRSLRRLRAALEEGPRYGASGPAPAAPRAAIASRVAPKPA